MRNDYLHICRVCVALPAVKLILSALSVVLLSAVGLASCSKAVDIIGESDEYPAIFPDYIAVTIPFNIAPLNFSFVCPAKNMFAVFKSKTVEFKVNSSRKQFVIPDKKWKALLRSAKGDSIAVTVYTKEKGGGWKSYKPFYIYVAEEPVDSYLAYRLIEPGYELWNEMGIYQRDLESYKESVIYENKMTNYNCVNCHSFCMQNPDRMLFHMRASFPGTILVEGEHIERLNTRTDKTISALVYPCWHPSGKYIAFSVNETMQDFHPVQRVEVYDKASDVIVYDVEKKKILAIPGAFSAANFETFPGFSPDGRTLFFCSAPACRMPDSVNELKYSLCSIAFDPVDCVFGSRVDTLYNAREQGKSVSFPRVSPDGKYLMCTLSAYGTFPVWHKDADLYMIDLQTSEGYYPDQANSEDTDSYHSWSSNSRWVVFSSRRFDGLYTRPFLTYIDREGNASKAFVLPQKEASYYSAHMKSFNIPEFISGKVKNRSYRIGQTAMKTEAVNVSVGVAAVK
jgi:hypothetical protein